MARPAILKSITNVWSIFGLALVLRWAAFYYYYFVYKTPGGIAPSPYANEVFDLLARALLGGQGLETWHFAYRPPLYPMLIAAVYGLFRTTNPLVPVFAQTFVSASLSLLTAQLAKALGAPPTIQKLAAVIAALDPASILVGLVLMAETLSNFFIAVALIFLARLIKNHQWRDVAACAASLILAALARPNAIYFFVPVALMVAACLPRQPAKAGVLIGLFMLGVAPWYFRNYVHTQIFAFSTTGDFNLLFYKAVSVEQWATGKAPTRIEAEFAYELERRLGIARPPESYDENSMWPYLVPADPRAEALMREMAWEVYRAHPFVYVFLIPVTVIKLLGFSTSLQALDAGTGLSLLFNLALYPLALLGGILALRKKAWLWLSITLVPIVYFLLVPAVTGGVQDTRARTNVTACFALLAAEGLAWAWNKRHPARDPKERRPTIFLDRDGVIIENRANYVRSRNDVAFIPGTLQALAALASSPYAVVIVTNQAGVGRGYISLRDAEHINQHVRDEIVRAGGRVDGLYLCPHADTDNCDCRKPRPGMLLRAARELHLDLARSWMIGDALTDLQAGEAAGARSVLVLTGRGAEQKAKHQLAMDGFVDLAEALAHITRQRTEPMGK